MWPDCLKSVSLAKRVGQTVYQPQRIRPSRFYEYIEASDESVSPCFIAKDVVVVRQAATHNSDQHIHAELLSLESMLPPALR